MLKDTATGAFMSCIYTQISMTLSAGWHSDDYFTREDENMIEWRKVGVNINYAFLGSSRLFWFIHIRI